MAQHIRPQTGANSEKAFSGTVPAVRTPPPQPHKGAFDAKITITILTESTDNRDVDATNHQELGNQALSHQEPSHSASSNTLFSNPAIDYPMAPLVSSGSTLLDSFICDDVEPSTSTLLKPGLRGSLSNGSLSNGSLSNGSSTNSFGSLGEVVANVYNLPLPCTQPTSLQSSKPIEPTQPIKLAQPIKPAKSVQVAKRVSFEKPASTETTSAKSARSARSAQPPAQPPAKSPREHAADRVANVVRSDRAKIIDVSKPWHRFREQPILARKGRLAHQ